MSIKTMGVFTAANDYIGSHIWILVGLLSFTIVMTLVLNVAALVHTLRGTKNLFTIGLCLAVITDCVLYSTYCYFYFV